MNTPNGSELLRDIPRLALVLAAIAGLLLASYLVVRPFLAASVWAAMIVVATWPVMRWFESQLGGRRWAATAVMCTLLLLAVVLPVLMAVFTLAEFSGEAVDWAKRLPEASWPELPAFVKRLPVVGERIAASWREYGALGGAGIAARVSPYLGDLFRWTATEAGNLGLLVLHFLLTVAVAGILYGLGEDAVAGLRRLARRLGGDRATSALALAGRAIRGVALGVGLTALAQALLGAAGLLVCGVPLVGLLTVLMFLLAISQVGPGILLLGATGWLYWQDQTLWGTVMLAWTVLVMNVDNFLRPWLIQRSVKLPLLLIFVGVVGGLLSFGIIGIFVGPVVLAVTYELTLAWVAEQDVPQPGTPPGEAAPAPPAAST
jgi:predicted PurR-regulated permease PerM